VEGTDPVAALAQDDPREQQAKQQIEQVSGLDLFQLPHAN
jgi:hypothetical protein